MGSLCLNPALSWGYVGGGVKKGQNVLSFADLARLNGASGDSV